MTNKNIKIEDNVLKQEDFDEIQQLMISTTVELPKYPKKFSWFFRHNYYELNKTENELDNFQFTHTFYEFYPTKHCI